MNASWVARHLNTSPQTVGRLIEEGKLRAYKLRDAGPWHVLLDSVHEYQKSLAAKYALDASDIVAFPPHQPRKTTAI